MYKVAILDDDEHWCLVAQRFLKQQFAVVTYRSVSAFFWELPELSQYDVLLIDVSLPTARHEPNINGIEIIARIKRLPRSPALILVTAYMSRHELAVDGKRICPEADGFFAKDAGLQVLAQQIKQLL